MTTATAYDWNLYAPHVVMPAVNGEINNVPFPAFAATDVKIYQGGVALGANEWEFIGDFIAGENFALRITANGKDGIETTVTLNGLPFKRNLGFAGVSYSGQNLETELARVAAMVAVADAEEAAARKAADDVLRHQIEVAEVLISRHRVYLYRTLAHGAIAPATPNAQYDGETLTGITAGWTAQFPLASNFDTHDYYESVAWWSGTALEDWSAPFKIDHDPFVTPEELASEANSRAMGDMTLDGKLAAATQAAAEKNNEQDAAITVLELSAFDKQWNNFAVFRSSGSDVSNVVLQLKIYANSQFGFILNAAFSEIKIVSIDGVFTDASMDALVLNRSFEFLIHGEGYRWSFTERTASTSETVGAETVDIRTYTIEVEKKGAGYDEYYPLSNFGDAGTHILYRLADKTAKDREQDAAITALQGADTAEAAAREAADRALGIRIDAIPDVVQPVLALGTGVAEVASFVALQHPTLPLDSTITPYSFVRALAAIKNSADTQHAAYRVPTSLASGAGGAAGGDYAVQTITHNGAAHECLVITLKERLDTYSTIYFYTASNAIDFPVPNEISAKNLAGFTLANGLSFVIESVALHTGNNYKGFVIFTDGDKKIYVYEVGSNTEYLGWVNLDRIAAQKGEKGDEGDGKHASGVAVDDGKVKITLSDNTAIESPQFVPSPANQAHARVIVSAVRDANRKINMTATTSAEVVATANALSDTVDDDKRLKGQHIRVGSIPENRLSAAAQAKLNSGGGGGGGGAVIDDSSSAANKVLSAQKTRALIAEEDQKVKDASRFLLASWRGSDGSPFVAGGGSLPIATAIQGAAYDATNERVSLGVSTQGIGWENTEIDFERFEMVAKFQVGAGWNEMFYWGVRDEFVLNSNGTFNWNSPVNNSGFAIQISPRSGNRVVLIAFNAELNGSTTFISTVSNTSFVANATHEVRIAVINKQVRVSNNEGDLVAEFTIPDTLHANARGIDGGRFGMIHDGDPSNRNVYLHDIFIKQPDVNSFAPELALPVVRDVSVAGGALVVKPNAGAEQRTDLGIPDITPLATKAEWLTFMTDMHWATEIQNYNNHSVPASPATIAIGYRIFAAGLANESHRIDFIFPNSTTKAQVDALVIGRVFSINTQQGAITLKPTAYVATAAISGGWHRERYSGMIVPSFADFTNSSDANNDYQTTLYRSGLATRVEVPKRVVPTYTEIDNISTPLVITANWQVVALKRGINILDYDELYFRFSPSSSAVDALLSSKIEYVIRASEVHTATEDSPAGLGGVDLNGGLYFPGIQVAFDVATNVISLRDFGDSAKPDILNGLGILGKTYVLA